VTRARRLVLLALAALLGILAVSQVPLWSSRLIAQGLSTFFERPATVGSVRYRFFPLAIEVRDVRVAGPTPQSAPFLEIPRLVAVPALRPLWERRAVLSRLHLRGATLRIHAYADGGDDLPRMKPKAGGGPMEVRIGRLVIEDGQILLDHQRVPLDLDLPGFRGRLEEGATHGLAGRVSFGPGEARFGTAPPMEVATEMDLRLDGTILRVSGARIRTQGADLAYRGQLQLAPRPVGGLAIEGPIDLGFLERHVVRTEMGLDGDAHFAGSAFIEGSRLRIQGHLAGEDGAFDGVAVPRFGGDVSFDERGLRFTRLSLQTLGGDGLVDLEVPPGRGTARLRAELRGVDAEELFSAVFDIGAAGVDAGASGPVELAWPRGRIGRLSGRADLDLLPRADGRTPLTGRFEWRAEDGVQTIEHADLRTPHTQLRLAGRIQRDRTTDLAVDGESRDLAAADQLGARLRRALGTPSAQPAGFGGAGRFQGRWRGSLSFPRFEGRFDGQDVSYLGVAWGRAEWAGSATPEEVRLGSLVVRRPGAEMWLDGRMETGFLGEKDALDLRIRLRGWPAADLVQALRWDVSVSGPVQGEAEVSGRRSAPVGDVRLAVPEGIYAGVPFTDLSLEAALIGGSTQVRVGSARVGGGRITFRGTVSDDGLYDATAEATDVELADLFPGVPAERRPGGRLSGGAVLQGSADRPRLQAHATSPRLFLGDEGVGALEARLRGTGNGALQLSASCRSPRVEVALEGAIGAQAPYDATLSLSTRETSIDPFLRLLAPRLPANVGLVVGGQVSVRGPLREPRALAVEAAVSDLTLQLPDYPVRNRQPLTMALREGSLSVQELHLSGEGTDLAVAGEAAVLGDGPLELTVRGAADLRVLSLVTPDLRGRGAAFLTLAVGGRRDAPVAEGTLTVEGGALRARGFPHGVEDLRGSVRFTQEAAHFEGVTGMLGGGALSLEGQAAYGEGRLRSFDVVASGRSIGLRYPQGLRSLLDAELRFFGDSTQQWLTGEVEVRQASWTRRYDLASELLAEARPPDASASLGGGLQYDVKVEAPGTLRLDNNLGSLQARADLRLLGTYGAPVVLGRAEVDRGRVYFQGNTYVIRRGTIDFVNPRRTDPLFDIEAETRIQSYRITLRLTGTLERVYPTLTADPYLSSVAILSLLAGADEATVAALDASPSQRDRAQTQLAVTGAATLAAGRISEEVGLEREAERLFGLNRFSIDPSAVRGDVTNPSARLTVGKRLTPDVNILYSTALRGTEGQLISLEYTLSDRLSVLLTRAEPGGFGFDVRLRQSR
jgi:translocation and assembly module TamB